MNKPSRHIDAAIAAIDRLFPIENEERKYCWKCSGGEIGRQNKAGLCKDCTEELREGAVDD